MLVEALIPPGSSHSLSHDSDMMDVTEMKKNVWKTRRRTMKDDKKVKTDGRLRDENKKRKKVKIGTKEGTSRELYAHLSVWERPFASHIVMFFTTPAPRKQVVN